MKAFEDLTHRGQVRRLRRLAQAALEQYGLGHVRLDFVAYSETAVFRVDVPPDGNPVGERYALRIHRPGHQTEASLDSELAWMAALKREAGLPVTSQRSYGASTRHSTKLLFAKSWMVGLSGPQHTSSSTLTTQRPSYRATDSWRPRCQNDREKRDAPQDQSARDVP